MKITPALLTTTPLNELLADLNLVAGGSALSGGDPVSDAIRVRIGVVVAGKYSPASFGVGVGIAALDELQADLGMANELCQLEHLGLWTAPVAKFLLAEIRARLAAKYGVSSAATS